MLSTVLLVSVLASFSALVRADLNPNTPDTGREGRNCLVSWAGDPDKRPEWKSTNIQLMSGDNFAMVHVTTVATDQDGTVDGDFSYPCPRVEPNSAIYFYQFTNPTNASKTWTTRFTIADEDGNTTPPAETVQSDGSNIPWGVGALEDTSEVVPPPVINGGSAVAAPVANSTTQVAATTSPSATRAQTTLTTSVVRTSQTGAPSTTGLVAADSNSTKTALAAATNTNAASITGAGMWNMVLGGVALTLALAL